MSFWCLTLPLYGRIQEKILIHLQYSGDDNSVNCTFCFILCGTDISIMIKNIFMEKNFFIIFPEHQKA